MNNKYQHDIKEALLKEMQINGTVGSAGVCQELHCTQVEAKGKFREDQPTDINLGFLRPCTGRPTGYGG